MFPAPAGDLLVSTYRVPCVFAAVNQHTVEIVLDEISPKGPLVQGPIETNRPI